MYINLPRIFIMLIYINLPTKAHCQEQDGRQVHRPMDRCKRMHNNNKSNNDKKSDSHSGINSTNNNNDNNNNNNDCY